MRELFLAVRLKAVCLKNAEKSSAPGPWPDCYCAMSITAPRLGLNIRPRSEAVIQYNKDVKRWRETVENDPI